MEENNNPINQNFGVKVNYLAKTFLWMFLGLFATGFVAYLTYSSGALINMVQSNSFAVLALLELVVVFVFSLLFRRLPSSVVAILYFAYAILNGFTMSVIFVTFDMPSVLTVFFAAAVVFGVFAFLGYKTSFDLSKTGNILNGVLFAGILVSFINLIIGSDIIAIGIDWLMLILFFGITAWDIQKIKRHHENGAYNDDKIHIYCAMEIYLDFINIFIRLLSIFGRRNN